MAKTRIETGTDGTWIFCDPDEGARASNLALFVHGYGGDADETWLRFPNLMLQADQGFFERFDIASFGYGSSLLANREDLESLTGRLRTFLLAYGNRAENLFIICHSLGGLLARRLLVDCHAQPRYRQLLGRVRQVHFVGVPHLGAAPARRGLVALIRPVNRLAWDLRKNSPELADTLTRWLAIVDTVGEWGESLPRLFNYVGSKDWVAPMSQVSDGRLEQTEDVEIIAGDHIAIARPVTTQNEAYILITRAMKGWAPQLGVEERDRGSPSPDTNTTESNVSQQGVTPEYEAHSEEAAWPPLAEGNRSYLQVDLDPDPMNITEERRDPLFRCEFWLWSSVLGNDPQQLPVGKDADEYWLLEQVPALIDEALNESEIVRKIPSRMDLQIEVVAPLSLMQYGFEKWRYMGRKDEVYGTVHPVVVKIRDRYLGRELHDQKLTVQSWKRKWDSFRRQVHCTCDDAMSSLQWKGRGEIDMRNLRYDGEAVCIGLRDPISVDSNRVLQAICEAGVPVAVWLRDEGGESAANEDWFSQISDILSTNPPQSSNLDLRDVIFAARISLPALNNPNHPVNALTLLWDNPKRLLGKYSMGALFK